MIRLFIAIDIPEAFREEVQGMGRSIANTKPVALDQLHLTLKFIGEVEGSRLLDIEDVLKEISSSKFQLCLKGVGTFPPRGMPRIVWVGVNPLKNITALRNTIERNLVKIDIARSKKKYIPHLTIARLKNSPLHHLQRFLAANALMESPDFWVESFSLYKSQLTPGGVIHTPIRSYALD